MKKYRYEQIDFHHISELEEYAKGGWQIVSIIYDIDNRGVVPPFVAFLQKELD